MMMLKPHPGSLLPLHWCHLFDLLVYFFIVCLHLCCLRSHTEINITGHSFFPKYYWSLKSCILICHFLVQVNFNMHFDLKTGTNPQRGRWEENIFD